MKEVSGPGNNFQPKGHKPMSAPESFLRRRRFTSVWALSETWVILWVGMRDLRKLSNLLPRDQVRSEFDHGHLASENDDRPGQIQDRCNCRP